ncbi:MAG TPA: hypothetical protein VG735_05995 [Caulobacterales bacterium]|nr:hypothetical protein [Caulobacterales bacterium]
MSAPVRRLLLAIHIMLSVAWLGSVAAFLALSLAGLWGRDAAVARAAYLGMNIIGSNVIIPLALMTLVSGLLQALTTPWGVLKHYWVLSKLVLALMASVLLVLHQFTAVQAAARFAGASESFPHLGRLGIQLAMDGALAIGVLIAAVLIAVYKPRGVTPLGRRVVEGSGQKRSRRRAWSMDFHRNPRGDWRRLYSRARRRHEPHRTGRVASCVWSRESRRSTISMRVRA